MTFSPTSAVYEPEGDWVMLLPDEVVREEDGWTMTKSTDFPIDPWANWKPTMSGPYEPMFSISWYANENENGEDFEDASDFWQEDGNVKDSENESEVEV
jgi:hypothetical protein